MKPQRPTRIKSILAVLGENFPAELVTDLENYIAELESRQPPIVSKGKYKPKLDYETDPDKLGSIEWEQPIARNAPVWTHQISCNYCGTDCSIETYSPHAPGHCGADACSKEHERTLARERKRRQRAREKQMSRPHKTP